MVMKASGAAGANPASGQCARSFAGIASISTALDSAEGRGRTC